MTYDDLGRLLHEQSPIGGGWTLTREQDGLDYIASMSTALGRTHSYQVEDLSTGDQRRTDTGPDGTATQTLITEQRQQDHDRHGRHGPTIVTRGPTPDSACWRRSRRR